MLIFIIAHVDYKQQTIRRRVFSLNLLNSHYDKFLSLWKSPPFEHAIIPMYDITSALGDKGQNSDSAVLAKFTHDRMPP